MAGTKHWTTGRLKDLVTGKYILTYPNNPNGIFQQGTGYEFNLPTYEDEKNSLDCNSKYYNTEQSQSFTRNNCSEGSDGSSVVYSVPAGRYSSDISLSAANQLALSEINTNGQNYANTNGTCVLKPVYTATRTQSFSKNNCGQYYEGSSVSYSKNYTSIISQQDADNKANNDTSFVTEGQTKANNEGTCTLVAISCGTTSSFTGGNGFPNEKVFNLGTDIGTVNLTYNTLDAPDKIQVIYKGNVIADTGYRGFPDYQDLLNQSLAAKGLPPETIQGGSVGNLTFTKNDVDPVFIIRVYSPLDFTGWSLNLGCPNAPIYNYVRTEDFIKDNCAENNDGSVVSFGKNYNSNISLQDAQQRATADNTYTIEGQKYANENGTCTPSQQFSYTRVKDFQKNNCGGNDTGSIVTFSRDYSSYISQENAQQISMQDASYDIDGQSFANSNGTCIAPLPSDAIGILVVDIYNQFNISPVGYVDTPDVVPYMQEVTTGNNFYPNGTEAAQCWELASDFINQQGSSLNWRFQFNIARLLNEYPAMQKFRFIIKDPSSTVFTNGGYSLKGADAGNMIMTGSQGNYIPSTSGATNIGFTTYVNQNLQNGIVFVYNVSDKTITLL